jgi:hypothetical protein
VGWLPVVTDDPGEEAGVASPLLGVVSRRSVAGAPPREPAAPVTANLAGPLGELGLDELFRHVQAVAAGVRGCYLVGGAVRDLLLGEPGFDVDLAVEGDGIAFATELAARLKGHVRPHQKFGTAVVVAPDGPDRLRVDVASTRAESYAYPGALPKVEHAGIRSDLARRDFTINAMAVSLKPETFGDLSTTSEAADLWRAASWCSTISASSRIPRASSRDPVRERYGLRMDEHTLNRRAPAAPWTWSATSRRRGRDELVSLLDEEKSTCPAPRQEPAWPPSMGGCRGRDTRRGQPADKRAGHARREMPRWRSARVAAARPGRRDRRLSYVPVRSDAVRRWSSAASDGRPRPSRGGL